MLLRLMEFCIEYKKKIDSIYTIIMILRITILLDIRKKKKYKWIQDLICSLRF